MIGTLYFVIKSTVVTFLIVCLLQIQFRDRTIEDRLMSFVRDSLAPQVLGDESIAIDHKKYRMSPKDIKSLRKKVFESNALKGVKKSAKSLFFEEMTEVMKTPDKKENENKSDDD